MIPLLSIQILRAGPDIGPALTLRGSIAASLFSCCCDFLHRVLKRLARLSLAQTLNVGHGTAMAEGEEKTVPEECLIQWMGALEAYARDWDKVFDGHPHYFTQEYWYLFVGVVTSAWQGRPLTINAACQMMKTGSARTREDRLKKAVQDGYLLKERSESDRRTTYVLPSPMLEDLIRGHLERTYRQTAEAFVPYLRDLAAG